MVLNPPNPTACGPWVFFVDAEGGVEAQSDRSAAVPRHTLTGRGDDTSQICGEKKNNELMMTHVSFACSYTHVHTQTHTFLMGSRISTGI